MKYHNNRSRFTSDITPELRKHLKLTAARRFFNSVKEQQPHINWLVSATHEEGWTGKIVINPKEGTNE